MRKKLFSISAIVAILCLTSVFVIWTFATNGNTLNLDFTVTGSFQGRGNYLRASSGTIAVTLPSPYSGGYTKAIGQITSTVSYSYTDLESLALVEQISVEIRIDTSFRRLGIGETVAITSLFITGCSSVSENIQYCVSAGAQTFEVGTVTRTGSNTWEVYASFTQTSQQGPPSLCVQQWSGSNVVDGFCIPLDGFQVVCTGTITT